MDIVKDIAAKLRIDEQQARGGIGLIFSEAQKRLGAGDFGQLTAVVPEIRKLIESAPANQAGGGGLLGALGGVASKFGMGDFGKLAELAAGFKSLNLNAMQASQFVPQILEWLRKNGGEAVSSILEKALK